MKRTIVCKFCGKRDEINGESYARQILYDHLEKEHPVEFENWKILRLKVRELNNQIHTIKQDANTRFGLSIL